MELEAGRFEVFEERLDSESAAVILAGHWAQVHVGQQRHGPLVALPPPQHGVVALAGAGQKDVLVAWLGAQPADVGRLPAAVHERVHARAQDELPVHRPAAGSQLLAVELAVSQQHDPAAARQEKCGGRNELYVRRFGEVALRALPRDPGQRQGVAAPDDRDHQRHAPASAHAAVDDQQQLAAAGQLGHKLPGVGGVEALPVGPLAAQPALDLPQAALARPAALEFGVAQALERAASVAHAGADHRGKARQPAQVVALGGKTGVFD